MLKAVLNEAWKLAPFRVAVVHYELFAKARKDPHLVDKTLLISTLNGYAGKREPDICVFRPHVFGKTMDANMICAYYSKDCDPQMSSKE